MTAFIIETVEKTRGPFCEDCAVELIELNDHIQADLVEADETDLILLGDVCQRCRTTF